MARLSRSLSLELSRLRRSRGVADATRYGLVWSSPASTVDEAALVDGDRVVRDFTIVEYFECDDPRWPPRAESRERVTRDLDDHGKVFAPDGRQIGVVRGRFLEYAWPADVVARA